MSDLQRKDTVEIALITTYTMGQGETAFHDLMTVLGLYDDIPVDLPLAEMAARVAGQNRARAILRRMGIWPKHSEDVKKAEALTKVLLQART